MIQATVQEATGRGTGRLAGVAACASSVLDNGLGRYEAARDAARQAFERDDVTFGHLVVAELAEAAARTGDIRLVQAALDWLSERTHLVAIDLPGFGHSQRSDQLLSPQAMGEFVIRAADAFGLEHPHVIGPDVGTAAALFAAARYPGRLCSLVVGSGGAAVPLQLGGLLNDWVEAPDLEEFRGADPRPIVAGALAGIERYVLPDPVREDYLSSYQGNRFAASVHYVRSYPAELPALAGLLPQIQIPVLIIAGARDTWVPPVNAEFLDQRLPDSTLEILDAGHFTWEDAAGEYAALVASWWAGAGS